MANTSVIRLAGLTNIIAVTSTASTPLLVNDDTNDQVNYCSFVNNGTKACAVKVSPGNGSGVSAVFPVAGTPGDYVLPPLMEVPVVLAVPTTPFYVSAVCASGDTTTLFVTPAADQS